MTIQKLFVIICLMCPAMWTTNAAAQGGQFATFTEAQLELYEAGSAAFQNGEYDKATERFRASLAVGKLNITYLNLGRSLYKSGHCLEAADAYDKVPTAPQVENPSPVQVLGKLDEFRADMATCPGYLKVTCQNTGTTLSVDGGSPVACNGDEPLSLPAGDHTVVATLGDEQETQAVTLKAAELTELQFALKASTTEPVVVTTPPPAQRDDSGQVFRVLGWTQIGLSAVAGTAGLIFFFQARESFQEAERIAETGNNRPAFDQAVLDADEATLASNLSYGIAAATLVSGVVFLVWLGGDDESEQEASVNFGVTPGGVVIGGQF